MTKHRLFALGDIHGWHQPLVQILDWIGANSQAAEIVFLGDFVDRGPASRAVIETLMKGPRRVQDRWIGIKGNHEEMLLDAHRPGRPSAMDFWMANGGGETLASYSGNWLPRAHLEWLENLPDFYETEHHCFVHAGLYPGLPPEEHQPQQLRWMRHWEPPPDMSGEPPQRRYERHIVYGHTPRPEVYRHPLCTGLDTGACFGLTLTAAEFSRDRNAGPQKLIQVDIKSGRLTVKEAEPDRS